MTTKTSIRSNSKRSLNKRLLFIESKPNPNSFDKAEAEALKYALGMIDKVYELNGRLASAERVIEAARKHFNHEEEFALAQNGFKTWGKLGEALKSHDAEEEGEGDE